MRKLRCSLEEKRAGEGERHRQESHCGFTLIELLIVIGILAILMGIVIVALNPDRQFKQARNSQRWSHVSSLLNAAYQNIIDNKGTFSCAAGAIPATLTNMSSAGGGDYDICGCLVSTYIAAMPYDPSATGASYTTCASYNTQYQIKQDSTTKRITVSAPSVELGETISLTR